MTEAEKLNLALDIARRLTMYGWHKSMNQLRKQIRYQLNVYGVADQERNFKLKSTENFQVSVHIRPGLESYVNDALFYNDDAPRVK